MSLTLLLEKKCKNDKCSSIFKTSSDKQDFCSEFCERTQAGLNILARPNVIARPIKLDDDKLEFALREIYGY